MNKDNNKNITAITYNHLNLPTKINFAATGNIVYIYNAAGQKVQKIVTNVSPANVTTTDYLAGYQYTTDCQSCTTILKFFPTAEGYVETSGSSYKYVYQYKDHLGNIRLSYDKTLAIQDENNYYPFGLKHIGYGAPTISSNYKYKFEGRELQDELMLNVYPFRYRTYDPAIGRFWSVDPVAEKYVYNGVYNFAENRVVESIDLEGKESWYAQDGSLATKAGPYTNKARERLNLYSPSEVQQMKAQRANNTGPMLSQDRLSPQQRKNQERLAETIPSSSTPSKGSTSKTSVREKLVEATKDYSEVAEKTSKAGQISSVIVGVVGVFTLQPEVVAGAILMFEGSSAVGVTGQVSKTVSLAADGNTQDATLEATGIILSTATGSWANSIPGTDAVTKEAVKTASDAAIDKGKTELIKELNKK